MEEPCLLQTIARFSQKVSDVRKYATMLGRRVEVLGDLQAQPWKS